MLIYPQDVRTNRINNFWFVIDFVFRFVISDDVPSSEFSNMFISLCVVYIRPPRWSSGQSCWLQIERSRVRFPALTDFLRVVGLDKGPFSLVRTIEELLGRNSSGSGLENREYGRGDPLRWPRDTRYQKKFSLPSPTSGGRSVTIVRLWANAMEFLFICCRVYYTHLNLHYIIYYNNKPLLRKYCLYTVFMRRMNRFLYLTIFICLNK
jgi:hypothetical protein